MKTKVRPPWLAPLLLPAIAVAAWACGDDAMGALGDAMVGAGDVLRDGASDAAAQPAMAVSCDIERTWRQEREDGSWSETTYWYASGDLSGLPERVEAVACGLTEFNPDAGAPFACPEGSTCTGDNPPAAGELECVNTVASWDATRWRVWCGYRLRGEAADGTPSDTGYRRSDVRVRIIR